MKNKIHRILINESEIPDGLEILTRFKSCKIGKKKKRKKGGGAKVKT